MHILHIVSGYPTQHFPLGGIWFRDQILALSREGIEEGIIFPDLRSLRTLGFKTLQKSHWQQTIEYDEGVPIFMWHGWNPVLAPFPMELFVKVAKKLFRDYIQKYGRPDLIHAHDVCWAGVAAHRIAYTYGIPYVITEHSSAHQRNLVSTAYKQDFREAFQAASKVMVVSSRLAGVLEQCYNITHPLVVPNMVDTDFFSLSPISPSDDVFHFCFVGNLIQIKNVDLLLNAFALAFLETEDIQLEIGGDGILRAKLEALAQSLGIASKVRFLGDLSREAVRSVMWQSNVFLLPSHMETFGVVLIEAMATGLPVIATRCGGPEDFIIPEVGILVEVGNLQGLANAMRAVYLARQEYAARAANIRKYAEEKFGETALVGRLLAVYKEFA